MGMRDKSLRSNRKGRHHAVKQHHPHHHPSAPRTSSSAASSQDDPFFLSGYDDAAVATTIAGGYCREEQMEELLLRHVDAIYNEAISKIAMVYDEDIALRAVLRNGHCYGTMDVLTNIVDNAMAYINSSNAAAVAAADSDDSDDGSSGSPPRATLAAVGMDPSNFSFSDIRHLEEYSLAGMICLLQEIRPELSRVDAMWCLLMSDLNVSQARKIEVPALPSQSPPLSDGVGGPGGGNGVGGDLDCYGGCGQYGGCGVEKGNNCSKRCNLSSAMRAFLTKNAALVAGIHSNSKLFLAPQIQQEISRMASTSESDHQDLQQQQKQSHQDEDAGAKDCDVVASVLKSLKNMNLEEEKEEGMEDHKKEMILNVVQQIRDLEMQVNERKEWAQKTAMQAALKLGTDLTELKILRMEREETQRVKKGKQTLEDSTLKRLSEMENALRKASGQVDRANAVVKQLEAENAEIRAEMEASKLSASESAKACMEVTKREKKCLKKLSAWQKQKDKLHKEISEEKRKISQMQQTLSQLKDAQKEAEAKWRQEVRAKEEAIMQVDDERRAKDAAEVGAKRRQEALRQKIEIDFQRHKDDIQRLEEEVSRLSSSAESTQSHVSSNISSESGRGGSNMPSQRPKGTGKMSSFGSCKLQESSERQVHHGWRCSLCMKEDALVVFLPCAHQILCINCNDEHEKRAKSCPNCGIRIKERFRVYGACS